MFTDICICTHHYGLRTFVPDPEEEEDGEWEGGLVAIADARLTWVACPGTDACCCEVNHGGI